MNIYRTDCRDCGKLIRVEKETDPNKEGIRVFCGRCDRSNYVPKYTEAEAQP